MSTTAGSSRYLKLAAFIAALLLIGFAIGYLSNPKATYGSFVKPGFAPPAWVFGPVWTILYIMIAIVGWRIHERAPSSTEMKLWWGQLGLNFIWSPVFFTFGARALAFVIIAALLLAILTLISLLWQRDRTAALMLVPYAAWVGFASALNAAIVWLN